MGADEDDYLERLISQSFGQPESSIHLIKMVLEIRTIELRSYLLMLSLSWAQASFLPA